MGNVSLKVFFYYLFSQEIYGAVQDVFKKYNQNVKMNNQHTCHKHGT